MLKQKPSMRVKRYYILVHGTKPQIEEAILEYVGVLGWAKAAPFFLSRDAKTIVAVNREQVVNVRAALAMSSHKLEVLKVSGTLKGLEKR